MLFSRRAKWRREDFYDRVKELELLLKALDVGEGLIVVHGVRRVGKTSLVYVGLTEANIPFVPVDLRRFSEIPSLLTPSTIGYYVGEVLKIYEKYRGKLKNFIDKILEHIESLNIMGYVGLRFRGRERGKRLFSSVLEEAERWARKRGTSVAIVLDEAQKLRNIPAWRDILAWAIDSLENVSFVVTGSEIGVLRDFLKLEDPESPLFGRARVEILLNKFSREQSIGFLRKGFTEANMNIEEGEIEDAVNKYDGIVGWLSLYGYYRVTYGIGHKEAVSKVEAEAEELVAKELEELIKYSPKRYIAILWAITLGLKTWSTIKHFAEGVVGTIPDNRFDNLLRNLVKYGFVEKTENLEYKITDPLTTKAIEKLKRKYGIT